MKENKALKILGNVLYVLCVLIIVTILIVVILQRVSNNNLAIGGIRIFNIATGSMVPKYEVGDILIAKEVPIQELKVGDAIVYRGEKGTFQGKVVTHEIISIFPKEEGGYTIQTKGIANEEADPTITEKQVYGKIIYKVQSLSFISKIINNLFTFYFLIFIPIAFILARTIARIIKNRREDEIEEKEIEEVEKVEEVKKKS